MGVRYSSPTMRNLLLSWSIAAAIAVVKYVALHLAEYDGVLIVTVGSAALDELNVAAATAGYTPYDTEYVYVLTPLVL